jgi:putative ABC transport system permease protein
MITFWKDLRQAARSLGRTPGYAAATVVILALGIGANAAIFSIVRTVLLRPLPFADSERLVRVWETYSNGKGVGSVSLPNYRDWREQATSFESMAAHFRGSRNVSGGDEPAKLAAMETTGSFFEVLGAHPIAGRPFTADEERREAAPVVVVGERLWRERYGADPALVGGAILLDGVPHTVVGVLPESFRYPVWGERVEIFVPLRAADGQSSRSNHYLTVIGKLREGIARERADEELAAIAARLAEAYPESMAGRGVQTLGLAENVRSFIERALELLFAAVSVVLLIACINLASLALARAAVREREMTLRAALGATRGRLARGLLAESALLGVGGALLAAVVASALLELAQPLAASTLPDLGPLRLDLPLLGYLLAAGLAAGLLFGVVPAALASRVDLARGLAAATARSTAGRGSHATRRALVAAQVALSLTLLVGAGLLLRTMAKLQATAPGFDRVGVLTLHLTPPQDDRHGERLAERLMTPILERVRALPGVDSAGFLSMLPVQSYGRNTSYTVIGLESPAPGDEWWVETRAASPGAFEALGVPLRAGRLLGKGDATATSADDDATPFSILVNEAFVRRHFPDGNALERRVDFGGNLVTTIVGVYGDTRQGGLDQEPLPEATFAYDDVRLTSSFFSWDAVLVVRSTLPSSSLARSIAAAVRDVDPEQPLHTVRTVEQVLDESLADRSLTMLLLGAFALVAVLLSGTGLYALVAYLVAQRTREVGVRMALGASAREIGRWVLAEGLALTGAGVGFGLAGGWGASQLVASQLHGVHPLDPATWLAVVAFLVLVALAASLAPAARAAAVDPIDALRQQ